MTPFWKLATAGFAATAITYGPARMGYGLFLSDISATFDLSPGTAGLLASLGFLGFFLALPAAYLLTIRRGARVPVVLGLVSAVAGMALVAASTGPAMLGGGLLLSMASAGFSWAPFNDAAQRCLPDAQRPAALSIISTGTGLGIVGAAAAALALAYTGGSWRIGWMCFAAAGLVALAVNATGRRVWGGRPDTAPHVRIRALPKGAAIPLYSVALSFGLASAIYISFAADWIERSGGLGGTPPGTASAVLFAAYGLCGLLGLATARARAALGLPWLLRLLFAASALSFGLLAAHPAALWSVLASAGSQGIFVMVTSAVMAFWSERLFPARPVLGFTAALVLVALGSVVGPAVAGYAADAAGWPGMLWGTAALSALTAAAIRPAAISERAEAA